MRQLDVGDDQVGLEASRAASSAIAAVGHRLGVVAVRRSRSQNSLMLRALSSTIRILAKLPPQLADCQADKHDDRRRQMTPSALALRALAATLTDERLAERFLDP